MSSALKSPCKDGHYAFADHFHPCDTVILEDTHSHMHADSRVNSKESICHSFELFKVKGQLLLLLGAFIQWIHTMSIVSRFRNSFRWQGAKEKRPDSCFRENAWHVLQTPFQGFSHLTPWSVHEASRSSELWMKKSKLQEGHWLT